MEHLQVESPSRLRTRLISRVLIIGVLAILMMGIWSVYRSASNALRAEENLHATLFSISLVDRFVALHGRWPRSWTELEQIAISNNPPTPANGELTVVRIGGSRGYDWPAASNEIQRMVKIDFQASMELIAMQDSMEFTAIQPIGPCYPYRDYGFVESLQDTIKAIAQPNAETVQ